MAVSGTTAIVGAPDHTVSGHANQGAAYVFTLSGGTWSQTGELTASDGAASDLFGTAVAVSGTTAIVGAPDHTVSGHANQGAAYVFTLSGGTWSQTGELTASDGAASDLFGSALAISGTTVVVGTADHTVSGHANQGAAYVFTLSGGTWSQTGELTASDGAASDLFGSSVAISGTTVVVGTADHTVSGHANQGAAYVFTLSGGTWSQTGELTASDGAASDLFGSSVAISGTTVTIGAPDHTVSGHANQGAAYVFTLSGGTWSQTGELTASDGAASDLFGSSVAISGTTVVVGAAHHTVSGHANQGAAYVFTLSGGTWSQTGELTASDGAASDLFGSSVAISGTTVVVGAAHHTVSGHANQGVAYVFSSGLVQQQGSTLGSDGWGDGSPSEPLPASATTTAMQSPAGQTVNPATGDVYLSATDVSLPGAGIPLAFTRTYDAQAAQAEVTAGAAAPALGYGWSDNLGMTLAYNATTQTATVTEENAAQLVFTAYVSGTSPAWCTSATNFCAAAPRIAATLNHNTGGTWTFMRTTGTQTTFTFNSSGVLTQLADPAGHTLASSSYSPGTGQTVCPSANTCTAWTNSASGRQLVLAVNSSGRLTSVFDANSTLGATFTYSGTGCTTWTGGQTADLCTVTDPAAVTSTFTYDSGNATASFDYDLLTGTPPAATAATTNLYDTSGRVSQHTDPSGAVTTYAYAGTNSSNLGGTTTLTAYPLGTGSGKPQNITADQFSANVLIEQTAGAGTTSAATQFFGIDPVSLLPLWSLDGDGNITYNTYQTYNGTGGTPVSSGNMLTVAQAGNTSAAAYNGFNQAWCTVDAADYANGSRCPSTTPTSPPAPGSSDPNLGMTISFYNSSDQLTARTDALGNTTIYAYTSGVSGVPNGLQYCSVDPVDYQKSVTCPAYGATHVTGTATAAFDAEGDKLSSTDADGNTTSFTYGVAGLPGVVATQTDPDGTTTTYTYNPAGQATATAVTFGTYTATTLDAYDSLGRKYCEVSAAEAAKSVTCPSTPPSSPPTITSDPYLGATITTFDADGRVVQTTNPLGGITYTSYDSAGEASCTVAPFEAAAGVACPSTPPSTSPTVGSDPYLGATITSFDANGRVVQVTNPLGGITLSGYDPAGNVVQTTVESNNTTVAPNIVTTKAYDADNRVLATTVASGTNLAATTLQSYDPNGGVYCSVSANAFAAGASTYQCPVWQTSWITTPPSPSAAVLHHAHLRAGQQCHHRLLQRQRPTGADHQPHRPDLSNCD